MNSKSREATRPRPEGVIQPNLGKAEGPKKVDARFVINTVVATETPREEGQERKQLVEITETAKGELQEAQLTPDGKKVAGTLFNKMMAEIRRENPRADTEYLLKRVARLRADIMQELLAPQRRLFGAGVYMLDSRRIARKELELILGNIARQHEQIEQAAAEIEQENVGFNPVERIKRAVRYRDLKRRENAVIRRRAQVRRVEDVHVKQRVAEEAQILLDQVEGQAVLEHIDQQFGSKGLVEFNTETKRWRYTDDGRANAREIYDWMVEQARPEPGEEATLPFADRMRIQIARLRKAAEIAKGRNLQLARFAEHGARSAEQRLALTEVRATEAEGGENSSSPWQRLVEQRKAEAEAQGKKVLPDEFYMAQIAPRALKLRESLAEAVEMRIWDEERKLAYSPFDIKTAIRTAEAYVVENAKDPAKALGKFYESRRGEDFVIRVLEKGLPEVASASVADIAEAAEGILLGNGEVGKIVGRVKELVAKNLLKPETFIKLAKGARYANVLASLFVPVAPVVLAKLGELDLGDMVGDVGELVEHMLQEIGEEGHEIAEHIHNFSVVSVAEAAEIEEIDVEHFCKQLERAGNIPEECVEHALAVDFGVESEAPKEKEEVLAHAAPLAEHWLREDKGVGSEEAERKSPPPPEKHKIAAPAVGTGEEIIEGKAETKKAEDIDWAQELEEGGYEVLTDEEWQRAVDLAYEEGKISDGFRLVLKDVEMGGRIVGKQEGKSVCLQATVAGMISRDKLPDSVEELQENLDAGAVIGLKPGETIVVDKFGLEFEGVAFNDLVGFHIQPEFFENLKIDLKEIWGLDVENVDFTEIVDSSVKIYDPVEFADSLRTYLEEKHGFNVEEVPFEQYVKSADNIYDLAEFVDSIEEIMRAGGRPIIRTEAYTTDNGDLVLHAGEPIAIVQDSETKQYYIVMTDGNLGYDQFERFKEIGVIAIGNNLLFPVNQKLLKYSENMWSGALQIEKGEELPTEGADVGIERSSRSQ